MIVNFIFNHHHPGTEDFQPSFITDLEAAFLLGAILLVLFGQSAVCGNARPVKISSRAFPCFFQHG
jgi:hypothetical protein